MNIQRYMKNIYFKAPLSVHLVKNEIIKPLKTSNGQLFLSYYLLLPVPPIK